MAGMIVFQKLTLQEALDAMVQAEEFFEKNPTRKDAKTDLFVIRRGHVVRDILVRTEKPRG